MKLLLTTLALLASGIGLAATLQKSPSAPPASNTAARANDPFHPGPEHARLQQLAGTWDAVVFTTDAQGAEQRTRGTLTRTAHTGFHTVDSYQGEFMGLPMIGHGMNGYCVARKQYFTYWTDSMTTSPMTLYGSYDAEKRELALSGECFGRSGKLEPCRTLTRYVDDDHHTWTFFGAGPDGTEKQCIRIEYTRKR
jgi:hypothetical protein